MSGAIILARLDSSRFPGKVMKKIQNMRIIEVILRRLFASGFSKDLVCVATTDRVVDDPLVLWAKNRNVNVYRGPVDDVARRCLHCAKNLKWDCFARVNADSPFVPGRLVKQGVDEVACGRADFATNLIPRSYPYGVSVEVVGTEFYEQSLHNANAEDLEHVTAHLYKSLPPKTKKYICPVSNVGGCHLAVDTPEDLKRIDSVMELIRQSPVTADPLILAGYIKGERQ
ncbi:MAG: hypothetical protein R6U40_07615 [Desulfobacterales bacterium]